MACFRWLALVLVLASACSPAPRRGATVLFASGADLQSINPLLTVHPLARQVQRYVLFTTLARYDSLLEPQPYLARHWRWSDDRRTLTFRLHTGVPWHDGRLTTAHDAAWTLAAARDPATGYPRLTELASMQAVEAPDDSTLVIRFADQQTRFPDVLTDLAVLPRHALDTVPRTLLRRTPWNMTPFGNGPFRFVAYEPNRRWVFEANDAFPAVLGGPPKLDRFIIVVVDEPTTKLAALASGELDFAGIQPAHAEFVRENPSLALVTYPLLFTYTVVFNTRKPPFDRLAVRRTLDAALNREEIVDGYVHGFGTPAESPVPPGVPHALPPFERAAASTLPAPIAFELLTVGSGEAALEQMLQARLARVGFEVTIRQLELSAFLARVYGRTHDFEAAVLGVPGDIGLGHLGPLIELAGMAAPDTPAAVGQRLVDSLPATFLYHARGVQGMNRRVKGVTMDLRGELPTVHEWFVR